MSPLVNGPTSGQLGPLPIGHVPAGPLALWAPGRIAEFTQGPAGRLGAVGLDPWDLWTRGNAWADRGNSWEPLPWDRDAFVGIPRSHWPYGGGPFVSGISGFFFRNHVFFLIFSAISKIDPLGPFALGPVETPFDPLR